MYKVELYVRVRRACMVEGMSTREAARVFGLHRDTVRKMLEYSVPPGYRRQSPPRRPKLDPYHGVIDRILEEDARFVSKSGVRTTLRTAAYNGRGYDEKVQRSGGQGCGRSQIPQLALLGRLLWSYSTCSGVDRDHVWSGRVVGRAFAAVFVGIGGGSPPIMAVLIEAHIAWLKQELSDIGEELRQTLRSSPVCA